MPTDKKENWEMLLGGMDEIVVLLSLEALTQGDQMKVIEKFSSIVFKRLLLRIPEEFVSELRSTIDEAGNDENMEAVIGILTRAFPDLNAIVREEMSEVAKLFRSAKKSS